MATEENRLVIVIDSKQAQMSAEDAERAISSLEDAGFNASRSTDQLSRSTKKGASDVRRYGRETDTASRSLQGFNSGLSSLATAIVGVGFGALIKNSIDTANALDDMSRQIGISVEDLSRLQYAARVTGVSVESVGPSLRRMSRRAAEAAQRGTGPVADALRELGIEAEAFAALSPEQQLAVFADQMENVESQSDRLRIGQQLLGREGVALIQTLEGGSEALRELQAESDRTGNTISSEFASEAAAANREIERLQAAGRGLTNQLALELAPVLANTASAISDNIDGITTAATVLGSLVVAIKAATVAQRTFNAVVRMNPYVLIATTATAAITALAGFEAQMRSNRSEISRTADEAEQLRHQLHALSEQEVRSQMSEVGRDIDYTAARVDYLRGKYEDLDNQLNDIPVSPRTMTQRREIRAEMERVEEQIYNTKDANESLVETYGKLRGRLDDLQGEGEKVTDGALLDPDDVDDLDDKLSQAMDTLHELRQSYDPVGIAAGQLADRQEDLQFLLRKGEISQQDYNRAMAQARQEYTEAARAADPLLSRLDDLNDRYLRQHEVLQALKDQRAAMHAEGDSAGFIQSRANRDLSDTIRQGRPQSANLDPSVGGAFSEVGRIGQDRQEYEEWYASQIELLEEYENERYGVEAEAAAAREELERDHKETIRRMDEQERIARLNGYASLFGQLGQMSAHFAGDSSRITNTLLAFQQAAQLASTIANIAAAQGNAAASVPFPANLGAMATVAAQTAGLITTIASIKEPAVPTFQARNYSGAFDSGGRIPSGKWGIAGEIGPEIIEGPARVTSRKDTADLMGSGGGGDINIPVSITVHSDGKQSDSDAKKQGRVMGKEFEKMVISIIRREQRSGGALRK